MFLIVILMFYVPLEIGFPDDFKDMNPSLFWILNYLPIVVSIIYESKTFSIDILLKFNTAFYE
jgi:hypothetical protein